MKLPVVDRIHPQSNTFAMGVKNKATGDYKLSDSPDFPPPPLDGMLVCCRVILISWNSFIHLSRERECDLVNCLA